MKQLTNNSSIKTIITTTIALLAVILIPVGCADSLFNPGSRSGGSSVTQPPASGTDLGLVKVTISGIGTHNMSASAMAYSDNIAFDLGRPSNIDNKALSFDGNDDFAGTGDFFFELNIIDGNPGDDAPFTFEAWVFPKSESGQPEIIFASETGNVVLYDPGTNSFVYDDNSLSSPAKSNNSFAQNKWYHVAVTVDASGNGTLYVNGKEETTFVTTAFPHGDARMGGNKSGFEHFAGRIDELRIWSMPRSQSEIKAAMEQAISPASDHLIYYYRFNKTETTNSGGTFVNDLAGNRNFRAFLVNGSNLTTNAAPIATLEGEGNGTIQMKPVSHGSFTFGTRGSGGMRYVWATFKVRNAEAGGTFYNTPRQNLTFMAADNNNTIAHSAILEMKLFNGEAITGSTAEQIAQHIIPTSRLTSRGGDLVTVKAGALQVFTESTASAINAPSGVDIFPYGFITRSPDVSTGSRTIPANPAPNSYAGTVTFAFKIPLQATAKQDPYKVSALFLPVDDSDTRITQSPGGQGPQAAAMISQRASYLNASAVTVLPGGNYRGVLRQLRCTPVRVSGAKGSAAVTIPASPIPTIQSLQPAPYNSGSSSILQTQEFTATFSGSVGTATSRTFVVRGKQSGLHFTNGGYTGSGTSSITTRQANFFPGEIVEVSVTAGLGICPGKVVHYRVKAKAGDGTFGTPVSLSVFTSYSMALGDVDNDADIDVVTISPLNDEINVWLGDNTGSFTKTAESPIAVDNRPVSVALGDLDGDGNLDIVTANENSDNVSVLLGSGGGGFILDENYTVARVGSEPIDVALGDLNADGDLDIVVVNNSSLTISVLSNVHKNTGFVLSHTYSQIARPETVALADINSDGILDIISGPSPVIFLGDGSGGFTKKTSVNVSGVPNAMVVGDLNGDEIPDIATANYNSDDVKVFFGNGDGTFSESTDRPYSIGPAPRSMALGDLNSDGALDIVVGGNDIYVLLNKGSGSFDTPVSYSPTNSWPVTLGDVNSDGDLDVMTGVNLLPGQ